MRRTSIQVALLFLAGAVGTAVGCANGDTTGSNGTGGSSGTGTGGSASGTGGVSATGGATGAGTGGTTVGTGGAVSTGGSPATGGSPGTGGATASTGGSPGTGGATTSTGGSPGTGGATTSTGGSPGTGGATTSTGGVSGTGGATGSAGSSGSGTFGQPACPSTVAKAGVCASTDPQLCYKTCGPSGPGGVKSETCTLGATGSTAGGSAYVEMSGCSFPPGVDYSCYKITTPLSSTCPTATPMANAACTVAACTPCNVAGMYMDSKGNPGTGYCVCTNNKWTCASTTAWPCPGNTGC
jgi:hypothetical protein